MAAAAPEHQSGPDRLRGQPSPAAAGGFKNAFLPNRVVSAQVMRVIIVVQALIALVVWLTSPFEVLPTPMEVLSALRTLWFEQGLGPELMASFRLNIAALFLSLLISVGLSYLTVLAFMRPIVEAFTKGRFLSLTGLTFVFMLLVGGGHPLKVSLLVFGMSVFFLTSMAAEVESIPRDRFDHARTLRFSEWRVVWEVVVLGTADKAFELFRQNAAIGWMMLTMVEGISRSEGGVGAMLLNQNKHFHLAEVFAIQLLIMIVGMFQDYVIGAAKRAILPYSELEKEKR
jgi:NitT/TauT family transport system permease protein